MENAKDTNSSKQYDVVIVGAGPTGLVLANLLARYNIKILLMDRNPQTASIPRAIVLDDEGSRTLQASSFPFDAIDRSVMARGSVYYDDNGKEFAHVGAGAPKYGFAKRTYINQPEVEEALLDVARAHDNVEIRFNLELVDYAQDSDGVTLKAQEVGGQDLIIRARWLAACDGGRSFVRQKESIAFPGETYEQDWLVIDTLNDPDHDLLSKFFCVSSRPHVSIPAPSGGRRYEFMLHDGERREDVLADKFVNAVLRPFRTLTPEDLVRKAVYTFNARVAETWRVDRILLAGDAAHLTPPFAGQGMNAGLRDAHNLGWKLGLVASGLAGPGLLDSYQQERKAPCWSMIQLAVAMGEFVMPKGASQIAIRNLANTLFDRFPAARNYLLDLRFKPEPSYDSGFFIDRDRQEYECSLVGRLMPQPHVRMESGELCLLDDILGPGFALIAQNDEGEARLSQLEASVWPRLGPSLVSLRSGAHAKGFPAKPLLSAVVEDREFGKPLRTHRDQVLLLRPDRYVLGAFNPCDEKSFGDELGRMLAG